MKNVNKVLEFDKIIEIWSGLALTDAAKQKTPASVLQFHKDVTLMLDKGAASLL